MSSICLLFLGNLIKLGLNIVDTLQSRVSTLTRLALDAIARPDETLSADKSRRKPETSTVVSAVIGPH